MENNKTDFEDADSYSFAAKDKISFREIVLEHTRKTTVFGCAEFRGGYWQDKLQKMQGILYKEHFYVPDSREEFANAVDRLADLLCPHFDKEMVKEEKELNDALEKKHKEVFENSKIKEKKQFYKDEKVLSKAKLFRSLSKFLYRAQYLESKEMEVK